MVFTETFVRNAEAIRHTYVTVKQCKCISRRNKEGSDKHDS